MATGTDDEPDGPTLVGPRVRLRRPTADDADAFVAAVRASADLHRGWATAPDTPEAFAAYLIRVGSPTVEGFLVVRRGDDALVGRVTLSQIFRGDFQNAYVGYEALAGHERRGYLTEGVGLALDHAFGALALHRVEANIQPGNAPSLALVQRLGFRREGLSRQYLRVDGLWRDHERWAILAEERRVAAGAGAAPVGTPGRG